MVYQDYNRGYGLYCIKVIQYNLNNGLISAEDIATKDSNAIKNLYVKNNFGEGYKSVADIDATHRTQTVTNQEKDLITDGSNIKTNKNSDGIKYSNNKQVNAYLQNGLWTRDVGIY